MRRVDRFDLYGIITLLRSRLDWREEVLSLALIVAESAILYLYLGILLPDRTPPAEPFPGWLIFGLLTIAYFLPHLLDVARVWGIRFEATLAIGVTLSYLMSVKIAAFPQISWFDFDWIRGLVDALILVDNPAIRPVWGVTALVVYAWWRGRTRAEPMLDAAYQMLRWGTLLTGGGLLLVLAAADEDALILDRMSVSVVIFFAAALASIGLARLQLEGMRSGTPLGGRWLATFAAPIVAVVLTGVIAAGIFSRRFLDTLLVLLAPGIWLATMVLRAVVIFVALLAFILIAPILWLLERQGFNQLSRSDRVPPLLRSFEGFREFTANNFSVDNPIRYLIVALILFLLVTALTRYVFRRRRRWRDTANERRESVLSLDQALADLGDAMRGLFRRRRSKDSLARLRGDARWIHTVFIRETYRQLQEWGAHAGVIQGASMTPLEYVPGLTQRFPTAGEPIRTIVDLYAAARYSGEPATSEQAETVRHAWTTLINLKLT